MRRRHGCRPDGENRDRLASDDGADQGRPGRRQDPLRVERLRRLPHLQAAGSAGKVGPGLDTLAADASKANQGPLDQYTFSSIKNPSAYVVPGFQDGVMPAYGAQLTDAQIADLAAFLTKQS